MFFVTIRLLTIIASRRIRSLGVEACNDVVHQVQERQQQLPSMLTTTRRKDGNLLLSVLILSELVPLISSSRMLPRQRFLSMAGTNSKLFELKSEH
jgi:hypothetical protein